MQKKEPDRWYSVDEVTEGFVILNEFTGLTKTGKICCPIPKDPNPSADQKDSS